MPDFARPLAARHVMSDAAAIILFDGVCNFCSGVVRFVHARDPRGLLRFAALQSDAARRACAAAGHALPATPDPDTIVVIADGRVLERSDAVLAIAARLRAPWPMVGVFRILPRGLRDAMYRIVARNRYRWFGRSETCMVPTPELRARFID
jgi:predicted DCC family thiol-disulfide oxidoreductase YuxK